MNSQHECNDPTGWRMYAHHYNLMKSPQLLRLSHDRSQKVYVA
jgi:hypothetical protein